MPQTIVSILTTFYNRKKYIVACIDSLLASVFQDGELIIVDNQFRDFYFINTIY